MIKKGEILRKSVAAGLLVGAVFLGQDAVNYQKGSNRLSNIDSTESVQPARLAINQIDIDNSNFTIAIDIELGFMCLAGAGLLSNEDVCRRAIQILR